MRSGVFKRYTEDDGDLRAELLVQPAINYALVHNRVPVVRHLAVTNRAGDTFSGARVTLELLAPEGPLAPPWSRPIPADLPPGCTFEWDHFAEFVPDAGRLRGNDEAFPVDYRLTVARPGRPDLHLTARSSVLAHNEWFNTPALYETLAAFVQPNTRAVEAVLRSAAQILLDRTGSGSLQGYQAGPERASQIAGAVYEALRRLGIHYQNPPASFENTGQKVRTTAAVLDARMGTCLDLSVTYAACLEAAGLHPLIWLTATHAFAGFRLDPDRLGDATVTETNVLISMVESGRAVPVELTRIGPGTGSADFAAAVEAGLAHFRTRADAPRGLVDVHLAHRSGVRPLPSAETAASPVERTGADGVGSIDLPAGVARTRLRALAEAGEKERGEADGKERDEADGNGHAETGENKAGEDGPDEETDESPARVQQWKRSLLDLSLRNPLLNLPQRGRGLELHVPPGALALLDGLVHEGTRIQVIAQDAISPVHELTGVRRAQELDPDMLTRELRADHRIYGAVTEQKYVATMRRLQRDARTMEQETGSNYLYLTIGTLVHGKGSGGAGHSGTEAHAPLFLLPVRIEGGTGRRPYVFVVDGSEPAVPNYCLVEWLHRKHGVQIPELTNPVRDDYGIDIAKTLAAINARIVDSRLNCRIDETASLRLLQFSTYQMWRDLNDHWRTFLENPVVRHLVEAGGTRFDDPAGTDRPEVDEAELHLPIPADGSQMQAIVMAERGQSFVLEGPPGTGKSQTITNLIARAVAAGRSVLFVAEKEAALDVVKRRLDQVGLAPFALDLHGRRQSNRAIREQLREALDQAEYGDDVSWKAVETGYRSRLAPLAAYPALVHSPNAAGLSAWSAYEQSLAYGEGPSAPVPLDHLAVPAERRRRVEEALREFPAAARAARLRPGHPWSLSGRRTLDGLHADAVTQIAAELEGIRRSVVERPALVRLLRELPGPAAIGGILPVARLAARAALPDETTMRQATDARWEAAVTNLQEELSWFRQAYASELATFQPMVFTLTELAAWHAEAQEAGKRLFGKGRRLRAIANRLAPYLPPGAVLEGRNVERVLARLLAAQRQSTALHQRTRAIGGLPLPAGWLPTSPAAHTDLAEAKQANAISRQLMARHATVWPLLADGIAEADVRALEQLAAGWRAWRGLLQTTRPHLRLWADGGHWFDAWQRDGATWLTDLRVDKLSAVRRWSAVLTCADALTEAGLTDYRDQLLRGDVDPRVAEEAYHRGVAATALSERLWAGSLDSFDADQHDRHIERFGAAAERMRTALLDHIPSTLVRSRPFGTGEQRRERIADFAAELRRNRGGRSFRELFQTYPDVVLALTPCVLVSPASVANFLAPDAARFDLVVFDEASQIRVAEAIGAMGRGKAVVVVGDSRQLPPSPVMQVSAGGDDPADDGVPAGDLESILSEAVESGLPQRMLTWHYRSRDESLIAFSNRHYYEGKLSSLPSPVTGSATGIGWRRVDGHFDRGASRTNEVEARAVVAEIARRLRDPRTAHDSIGVVTFNLQQRDLILNLLEDSSDRLIQKKMSPGSGEPIFVKNLENVQGDERDVILFSLAFSTNPETGQLPLNFGPLSQAGGERRLNVAITRARRQVLLFASFDPGDIDLSRTAALGTHHLRAYCEMAVDGVDRLGAPAAGRGADNDRVRREVAEAIHARGHEVRVGYGLSDFAVDIAVRAPGSTRWQVAVLLDGPRWGRRPTVADRDGAPTLLRTVMGWSDVIRFWLPSWIHDRTLLLDKVDAAVARAVVAAEASAVTEAAAAEAAIGTAAQPETGVAEMGTAPFPATPAEPEPVTRPEPAPVTPPVPADLPAPRSRRFAPFPPEPVPAGPVPFAPPQRAAREQVLVAALAAPPAPEVDTAPNPGATGQDADKKDSGLVPFVPYEPSLVGSQSDIDAIGSDLRVRALVQSSLREIIAAEGPIEAHRLAKLTLARFGFARPREDRRNAVLALVDQGVIRRHEGVGSFAWPGSLDPKRWNGFRTTRARTDRAFEEIAPEEVANAVRYALAATPDLTEQELFRAALELLGYQRRTQKITKLLRYGLLVALTSGRVVHAGRGRYRLS